MEMYTSPLTGNVYNISVTKQTRTAYGEFMNPNTAYDEVIEQFNIYRDGKFVQFAFSEGAIPETIARYESPGPDIGSPWD